MKKYLFTTVTTMKDEKYWIDDKLIRNVYIQSENVEKALINYVENHCGENYVTITKNALKNKKPMYRGTTDKSVQVGYVITASTEVENAEHKWVKKYLELWVEIEEINNPF
ncbi:hypothetical protein LAV60_15465 [Clostridium sporogenes]|uniref:hypothetical protein n=1 Tax=Clostridium sporogenes TaxID=1509 RepID=UPI0022371BA1|nr:hypothetical protein [Clostridium sporogenes]MCW6094569.1 hypothetical protein [Clostridium sporogenes]